MLYTWFTVLDWDFLSWIAQDIHYQGHELRDAPAPLGYHWGCGKSYSTTPEGAAVCAAEISDCLQSRDKKHCLSKVINNSLLLVPSSLANIIFNVNDLSRVHDREPSWICLLLARVLYRGSTYFKSPWGIKQWECMIERAFPRRSWRPFCLCTPRTFNRTVRSRTHTHVPEYQLLRTPGLHDVVLLTAKITHHISHLAPHPPPPSLCFSKGTYTTGRWENTVISLVET